ncbi:MAG: carboxypeptidase-like regulatory domain-containing protein, partial [Bryobacteraceae bacterium]
MLTKLYVLIACAAIAVPVLAGEDQPSGGSWNGTLRDAHGAAIAGAVVRVQSAGTKAAATTRSDGQFEFAGLPAGEYSVSVEYKGSTATCSQQVRLPGSASAAVLELSAEGSVSLLAGTESPKGTGGEQLSAKTVSAMPLNKRDFSQLLLLAAGTMTDTNGASNFTQQFAVNGQRGTAAVFAMDGADSSDPEMGGATFTNFNVDAVQ